MDRTLNAASVLLNEPGLKKDGNCMQVMESWEELRNTDLPEGTLCTVTINIRHGAACPFKRGTCNSTCHGLLRPVTAAVTGDKILATAWRNRRPIL